MASCIPLVLAILLVHAIHVQSDVVRPKYRWLRSATDATSDDDVKILLIHLNGIVANASHARSLCREEGGTELMIFDASTTSPEMEALNALMILDKIWLAVEPVPNVPLTQPARLRYRWSEHASAGSELADSAFWKAAKSTTARPASPEPAPPGTATSCRSLAFSRWDNVLTERLCEAQHGVICRIEVSSLDSMTKIMERMSGMYAGADKSLQVDILADLMPHLLTMVLHKVQDQESRMNRLSIPTQRSATPGPKTGMDADEEEENSLINQLIEATDHRTNHAVIVAYIAAGFSFTIFVIFFVIVSYLLIQRPDVMFMQKTGPASKKEKPAAAAPVAMTYVKKKNVEFEDQTENTGTGNWNERGVEEPLMHPHHRQGQAIPVPAPQPPVANNNNSSNSNNSLSYRTVSV